MKSILFANCSYLKKLRVREVAMYRALGNYILQRLQYTEIGRALWSRLRQYPAIKEWAHAARATIEDAPRDLEAIANLSIPENKPFLQSLPEIDSIEGMFSHFSMAVVDSLLSYQKQSCVTGDLLEFGVFRGKSAALIGRHLNPPERFLLVDIEDFLDRSAIASFQSAASFMVCGTQDFKRRYASYNKQRRSFRFIHVDASHDFGPTFRELRMADDLLADDGIIAMDDFGNFNYSQNIAGIFKYLFTTNTDLTVFLVTDEKAYLCRRSAFTDYATFVLDRLLAEVSSRRVPSCLARTENDPDFRPFYLRPCGATEDAGFYGLGTTRYRRMLERI